MLKSSIKTLSLGAALALAGTGVFAQTTGNSTVNNSQTPATIGVSPQTANEANQKAIQRSDTGTLVRTDESAAQRARDATSNVAQNNTTNNTGASGTTGSTGATGNANTTGNASMSNNADSTGTGTGTTGTTGAGTGTGTGTGTGAGMGTGATSSTMDNNTDRSSMDTTAQNRAGMRSARADRN